MHRIIASSTTAQAAAHIAERDRKRAKHYRYITDQSWGNAQNHHLCLDSSSLGIEKCIEIILISVGASSANPDRKSQKT